MQFSTGCGSLVKGGEQHDDSTAHVYYVLSYNLIITCDEFTSELAKLAMFKLAN